MDSKQTSVPKGVGIKRKATQLMPRPPRIRSPLIIHSTDTSSTSLYTQKPRKTTAKLTKQVPREESSYNDVSPSLEPRKSNPWDKYLQIASLGPRNSTIIASGRDDNQLVAVKRCERQLLTTRRTSLLELKHESIVQALEIFLHDDVAYVVSEYLDVSLSEIIGYHKDIPEINIGAVCSIILGAIQFVWSCGLIHGNIASQNILISVDHVKLASFGTSFPSPSDTTSRTDIEAIGVLAIQMKQGYLPEAKEGLTVEETIKKGTTYGLEKPELCSAELLDFLQACLLGTGGPDGLLKHPFVQNPAPPSCMNPLLVKAQYFAHRLCAEMGSHE